MSGSHERISIRRLADGWRDGAKEVIVPFGGRLHHGPDAPAPEIGQRRDGRGPDDAQDDRCQVRGHGRKHLRTRRMRRGPEARWRDARPRMTYQHGRQRQTNAQGSGHTSPGRISVPLDAADDNPLERLQDACRSRVIGMHKVQSARSRPRIGFDEKNVGVPSVGPVALSIAQRISARANRISTTNRAMSTFRQVIPLAAQAHKAAEGPRSARARRCRPLSK